VVYDRKLDLVGTFERSKLKKFWKNNDKSRKPKIFMGIPAFEKIHLVFVCNR